MKRCVYLILLLLILSVLLLLFNLQPPTKARPHLKLATNHKEQLLANESLFDVHLNYTIKSDACADPLIFAVILVTSYFGNVETRSAMRRAFSGEQLKKLGLRRVFLLAAAPEDVYTRQNAVENEANRFGDIIQGNFREAYRNLTYKHMMGIKWANRNCGHANFIIKMDDDIVVDLRKVVALLKTTKLPSRSIAGYILKSMAPIREPANKWYVSLQEYEGTEYPVFVSGWFYVTTPEVCASLDNQSLKARYFWIDDVFVTGILAKFQKIRHYDLSAYFTVHPEFLQCCIADLNKHNFDCDILVGPNGGDNNLFFKFNEEMKKCSETVCDNRTKRLDDTCVAERKFSLGKGKSQVENYQLF